MISYDSLYRAVLQSLNESSLSGEILDLKVPSSAISINAGASYDIKPPEGKRWTILNLYLNGQCDFKIIGGTTEVFKTSYVAADIFPTMLFLTENHFIRITNTGSTALTISYEAHEGFL